MARTPLSPGFWRSPLRGPRFTALLGVVLLAGITVLFVTGMLSYAAYNPDLTSVNDKTPGKGLLGFFLFDWPTDPSWLYRLTQGVHVTLGIALVPVLLAKLWSVVPRLFQMPPARSLTHALERLSVLLLVGGALFEFVTGVLNVQLDYLFPGSFYPLHLYGAWVFIAAFVAHVVLRAPMAFRYLRERREAGADGPDTAAEPVDGPGAADAPDSPAGPDDEPSLVAPDPDEPSTTRRGALLLVGGGSLLLLATTAGRSFDGPLRATAVLAPHGGAEPDGGGAGFQINKTAASRGITATETSEEAWRLTVTGPGGTVRLAQAQLRRLRQHSADLPIACVEGWSTSDQRWRGVRLRDLAALVGYESDEAPDVLVESLQRSGSFRTAGLRANQVRDSRSLLALDVNGEPLTADHGAPARIIVPAAPGVLNTKWVSRLTFEDL